MNHVVDMAKMKISTRPGDLIVTRADGGCLSVTMHDPAACVGGMVHVVLPLSITDPENATKNPCIFVDTGVPKLIADCYRFGARKEHLEVKAAGGADAGIAEEMDSSPVGKRNFIILRKLLWKNGLLLNSYDIGGNCPRIVCLEIGSGKVTVETDGRVRTL